MSEPTPDSGRDEEPTTASAPEIAESTAGPSVAPKAAPSRRRRRMRRFIRVLWITAVVLVLIRVGLQWGLRFTMKRVAAAYGLELVVENLNLSVLGAQFELWDLVVRDADAEEGQHPLLHIEYAGADVDVRALFSGRLVVDRVEVDGLEVRASLREDGSPDLPEPLLALLEPAEPELYSTEDVELEEEPDPPSEEELLEPLDFSLPFEVRVARIQETTLFFEDRSVDPPVTASFDLNVRVSRFGQVNTPARLELQLRSPQLVDSISLSALVRNAPEGVEATFDAFARGLRLATAEPYLVHLGLAPEADALSFSAQGAMNLATSETAPHVAKGFLALANLAWSADTQEAAALDRFEIQVLGLQRSGLTLGRIDLAGVRGRALRGDDGALRLGGLRLVTPPPSTEPDDELEPEPDRSGGLLPRGFTFDLDRLSLRDFAFDLEDRVPEPPLTLELRLESFESGPLVSDPTPEQERVPIEAVVRAPGIVDAVRLSGFTSPYAERKLLELQLDVEGVHPTRLEPYMESAGVESILESGELRGKLDAWFEAVPTGGANAGLRVGDIAYRDGEAEFFAIDSLSASGIELRPGPEPSRIAAIELVGTRLVSHRDAAGVLYLLGLRIDPALATPTAVSEEQGEAPEANKRAVAVPSKPVDVASAQSEQPAREEAGGGLVLERVTWTETKVEFRDEFLGEPRDLDLENLEVELGNLTLGVPKAEPAELRVRLTTPGLVDDLAVDGVVTPADEGRGGNLELTIRASGLSLELLQPYLDRMSVESSLDGASVELAVGIDLEVEDDAVRTALRLNDFVIENAGEELAHLGEFAVTGIEVREGKLFVDHILVADAAAGARRDAEGIFEAMGLRLLPFEDVETAAVAPEAQQGIWRRFRVVFGETFPPQLFSSAHASSADLRDATFRWRDDAVLPPVDLTLTAAASAAGLERLDRDSPLSFEARLGVGGVVGELAAKGELAVEPGSFLSLDVEVTGEQLTLGPLADYFPPGVECVYGPERPGRFTLELGVRTLQAEDDSRSLEVELRSVDLRGEGDDLPALALSRASLKVPVFDLEHDKLEVAELAVEGAHLSAVRQETNVYEALGWTVNLDELGLEAPTEPEEPVDPTVPVRGTPLISDLEGREDFLEDLRGVVPTVVLGRLDVGVEELRLVDHTRPGEAVPLLISLRVSTAEPQELIRPDPINLAPFLLSVEGSARPVFDRFDLGLELALFADDPHLGAKFELGGLRGAGVTEVFPGLADRFDGSGLEGGSIGGAFDVYLRARRTGPLDFELASGFGLEAEASDLAIRDGQDGTILAGLDHVYVEVDTVRPTTGEVHVRSIELETPRARLRREAEGYRVVGILLKFPEPPEPELEPASEPAPEPAPEPEPTVAVAPDPPAPEPGSAGRPAAPGGELKIDRILVTGIDVLIEDTTGQSPTLLPLTELDVEILGVSNRLLTEPRTLKFHANLASGEIELARRVESRRSMMGILGGVTSGVTGLVGGGAPAESAPVAEAEPAFEQRPALDEISVAGRVALYPDLRGWTTFEVRGLELANFRGPAEQAGVVIEDGVFENATRVRFRGAEGIYVNSLTTLSHMKVSEGENGPIRSTLRLPATLETALFVTRNEAGENSIPIEFRLDPANVSAGAIYGAAVGTLGKVITESIARSPARVVGGIVDFTGLSSPEPVDLSARSVELTFEAGTASLDRGKSKRFDGLLSLLHTNPGIQLKLQHEFGPEDFERAAVLANPEPEMVRDVVAHLRQRRAELVRKRDILAASIRASYGLGRVEEVEPDVALLQELEGDLGRTELALDGVLELLRRGADRRRDRRTRGAAMTLAELRLVEARALVSLIPFPHVDQLIVVERPRIRHVREAGPGRVIVTPVRASKRME